MSNITSVQYILPQQWYITRIRFVIIRTIVITERNIAEGDIVYINIICCFFITTFHQFAKSRSLWCLCYIFVVVVFLFVGYLSPTGRLVQFISVPSCLFVKTNSVAFSYFLSEKSWSPLTWRISSSVELLSHVHSLVYTHYIP